VRVFRCSSFGAISPPIYLVVGKARELEGVLVQQVASLRGELNTGALDEERVVVLDKEPVKNKQV
jgi:hypothetical protein